MFDLPDNIIGSTSLYSRNTQIISLARSMEYMNCLKGLPVPSTLKTGSPAKIKKL